MNVLIWRISAISIRAIERYRFAYMALEMQLRTAHSEFTTEDNTMVRAGNGKFVSKSNPIALMAGTVASAKRAADDKARADTRARRSHGYRGPLTRADLSAR